MKARIRWERWGPLTLILMLGVALRVWCWVGPDMAWLSDESRFATVVKNMTNGYLPDGPTEWFGTRAVLLAPAALFMRLFGASDVSVSIWPFIGSMGAVVMAYLLGRDLANRGVGLMAAGLVAAAPIEVRLSGFLRPDAILPAFVALSVWCALRAARSESHATRWAVGGGLALGAGWSVRESALIMAPVVIAAAWPVLRRVIVPGIIGAVSVPLTTALVWVLLGGSAMAPISSAGGELAYRNPIAAWNWSESYTSQLLHGALRPNDLLFFAGPVVVATLSVHWFREERRAILPMIWLAWAFFYLEFGTLLNVTKPYRYLTLCVIPAAILVALALDGLDVRVAVVAATVLSVWVLSSLPIRRYRSDDVVLLSRVSAQLAKLPAGPIATESYTWWTKLHIYRATSRLTVPKAEDPAFSTPARIRQLRQMTPLPLVTDARYLVTGPVHPRGGWPKNWSQYRETVPSTEGLELVADLGRAQIWRLPVTNAVAP